MTATDMTGFCAFFSTWKSGNFLHIFGRFPLEKNLSPLFHQFRPQGVGEEGAGEKLNHCFSPGFLLWQAHAWYTLSPSRHHQILNFVLFSCFSRALKGGFPALNKPRGSLVQVSCFADPPWPTPPPPPPGSPRFNWRCPKYG